MVLKCVFCDEILQVRVVVFYVFFDCFVFKGGKKCFFKIGIIKDFFEEVCVMFLGILC